MIYKTYGEIREKVRNDLDLIGETFIRDSEMLGYANEAINECEAEIHTTYEDYFLTYDYIDLVNGQDIYDLPSNIYANKIRNVVYNTTGKGQIYEVKRLRHSERFELIEVANEYQTTDWYMYQIVNRNGTVKPQMQLVPKSREDLTSGLKIWYLRNANRAEDDNSIIDIPEFSEFVIQHMKVRCYEKEGHPNLEVAKMDLERLRQLMRDTLSNMVPDGNTELQLDLSFYNESS